MKDTLRGDLFGGFTAAIVAVPLAIAFGVLTFAPLGPEHASRGALAGLYGAIFTGFFASLLGGTPAQVTGPTGPMTVVMTSVVSHLMQQGLDDETVFLLAGLCVLGGGCCQLLLSALRLGGLIKYIPYPVIAGFMNGIAIIIFVGQLRPFAGLPNQAPLLDLAAAQPATTAVGVFTFATVWFFPRLTKAVPGTLAGLAVGTAAYYVVRGLAGEQAMGPVIGGIPQGVPLPANIPRFAEVLRGGLPPGILLGLLGPAVALGVLGAIDSLLTSVIADTITRTRHNSNRELVGQGVGNMVSACFGGVAGAGATVRTLVNIDAGGRTRISGMTHSLTLLTILLVGASAAGRIPMVVLAAILMVTAVNMIDAWSKSLIWKLTGTADQKRELAINLFVVLLVTAVTVAVDLMVAVAVGVGVACLLFVEKMGRTVIRRTTRGTHAHSRRVRTPEAMRTLDEVSSSILIVELQGPIFFGSADQVATAVEREAGGARFVILDMRLVDEIDSSGARILMLIAETLQDQGKRLFITYLLPGRPRYGFLEDMGVMRLIGAESVQPDTDRALEEIENLLLAERGVAIDDVERPFDSLAIAEGLEPRELEVLHASMQRRTFAAGQLLHREGVPDHALCVMTGGRASSRIQLDGHEVRLATYARGSVFGEIALFEATSRTSDITADSDGVMYVLGTERMEILRREHPRVAAALLWYVGRELSARLRATSLQLVQREITML